MPSATQEQTPIKTKNYLRPSQLQEAQRELDQLQSTLEFSKYPGSRVKTGEVRAAIARVHKTLEQAPPESLSAKQKDRIVSRVGYLEEQIRQGMPTDAEMRRNPTGAVEKHSRWMQRTKAMQIEWKNLQLALAGRKLPVDQAGALCNIERLRPSGGPQELGMSNCQIDGKEFFSMREVWESGNPNAACYEEIFQKDDPEKADLIRQVNEERQARREEQKALDAMRREVAELREKYAGLKPKGE